MGKNQFMKGFGGAKSGALGNYSYITKGNKAILNANRNETYDYFCLSM